MSQNNPPRKHQSPYGEKPSNPLFQASDGRGAQLREKVAKVSQKATEAVQDTSLEDLDSLKKAAAENVEQIKTTVDPNGNLELRARLAVEYVFNNGPQVVTAAAAVGTFLLLRKQQKGTVEFLKEAAKFKESQREAISYAIDNGLDFRHFPGVGVLTSQSGPLIKSVS